MSQTGELDAALDCYQKELGVKEKKYGPESVQAADVKERLAAILRRTGRADQANALYAQSAQVKWKDPAMPLSPSVPAAPTNLHRLLT